MYRDNWEFKTCTHIPLRWHGIPWYYFVLKIYAHVQTTNRPCTVTKNCKCSVIIINGKTWKKVIIIRQAISRNNKFWSIMNCTGELRPMSSISLSSKQYCKKKLVKYSVLINIKNIFYEYGQFLHFTNIIGV